jgi:hypothetical protein
MGRQLTAIGKAKLQKEQASAKLRTLQSDALEGRLLDRDMVRSQWAQAFASLRDRALGMADRVSSRGAGRSEGELRAIVDIEIRASLETVSRGETLIASAPS